MPISGSERNVCWRGARLFLIAVAEPIIDDAHSNAENGCLLFIIELVCLAHFDWHGRHKLEMEKMSAAFIR